MPENILERIIKKKIEKIINLKKTISSDSLNELIKSNKTFINFKQKIENNLKENKEVLTTTLSNIDNQLGEVISKTEKVNILEEQIRLKIKYHEEQNTNEKFVEGEKLSTEHDKLNQELSSLHYKPW